MISIHGVIKIKMLFFLAASVILCCSAADQSDNGTEIVNQDTGSTTTFSRPLGNLSSSENFQIDVKSDSDIPWILKITQVGLFGKPLETTYTGGAPSMPKEIATVFTSPGYYTLELSTKLKDVNLKLPWIDINGPEIPINWHVEVIEIKPNGQNTYISNENSANPVGNLIQITDVSWNPELRVIEITLNECPKEWNNWQMYLNGEEMPMEGGKRNAIVRPNAPLDQNPTGLFIGTDPWLSSLDHVDFPCCGKIKFYLPGKGYTNEFYFNIGKLCKTASNVNCKSTSTSLGRDHVRPYSDSDFIGPGGHYIGVPPGMG